MTTVIIILAIWSIYRLLKGTAEEGQAIREYAAAHGMSVQGLFLVALREYMENHKND